MKSSYDAHSIYGYDPESGIAREAPALPSPLPDDEITRLRAEATADRYRRADVAAEQRRERANRASRGRAC